MITQKFNKIYTEEEINYYLSSLSTSNVDESIRQLGYINASAFKGYGALSQFQLNYNGMIYRAKQTALPILAERCNDVAFDYYVIYFRLENGIQISFHITYPEREKFIKYYRKTKWDGIENSYTYNAESYAIARQEHEEMKRADNEKVSRRNAILNENLVKFLKNGMRRKSLGVKLSLNELKSKDVFSFVSKVESVESLILMTSWSINSVLGIDKEKSKLVARQIVNMIEKTELNDLMNYKIKLQ